MFRKVMSTEDTIQELASALSTGAQSRALRLALQVLGDLVRAGHQLLRLRQRGVREDRDRGE